MDWIQRIAQLTVSQGAVARVVIIDITGPTPRAEGAAMLVTTDAREGKIGRGAIESEALALARRLIEQTIAGPAAARWPRQVIEFATGPVLGEAPGGTMTLLIEVFTAFECAALAEQCGDRDGDLLLGRPLVSGDAAVVLTAAAATTSTQWSKAASALAADPARTLVRLRAGVASHRTDRLVERLGNRATQFHVYGTGLVARAVVRLMADLPFEVVWLDSEPANFPAGVPARVRTLPCSDLADAARRTRAGGFHAVMTATHELDLAVCQALLEQAIDETGTFAFLGVIGSSLKRQRLLARLAASGIPAALLARLVCPIGLPDIRSKSPEVIAVSIAAQTLIVQQQQTLAKGAARGTLLC